MLAAARIAPCLRSRVLTSTRDDEGCCWLSIHRASPTPMPRRKNRTGLYVRVRKKAAVRYPTWAANNPLASLLVLTSTRSEEHTSELQSHSFISYAVFCLQKQQYNPPLVPPCPRGAHTAPAGARRDA